MSRPTCFDQTYLRLVSLPTILVLVIVPYPCHRTLDLSSCLPVRTVVVRTSSCHQVPSSSRQTDFHQTSNNLSDLSFVKSDHQTTLVIRLTLAHLVLTLSLSDLTLTLTRPRRLVLSSGFVRVRLCQTGQTSDSRTSRQLVVPVPWSSGTGPGAQTSSSLDRRPVSFACRQSRSGQTVVTRSDRSDQTSSFAKSSQAQACQSACHLVRSCLPGLVMLVDFGPTSCRNLSDLRRLSALSSSVLVPYLVVPLSLLGRSGQAPGTGQVRPEPTSQVVRSSSQVVRSSSGQTGARLSGQTSLVRPVRSGRTSPFALSPVRSSSDQTSAGRPGRRLLPSKAVLAVVCSCCRRCSQLVQLP